MDDQMSKRASKQPALKVTKAKGVKRNTDTTLGWVARAYPRLGSWRNLAVAWLKGETRGVDKKLSALVVLFERYIIQKGLPSDPTVFLSRDTALPDFYRTVCPDTPDGIKYNNYVHGFINFVLLHKLSETDLDGKRLVSPELHNPVPRMTTGGLPKRDESVHSPLPYGYIDELRQILAAGPDFRDWQLAQSGLLGETSERSNMSSEWFEVTEDEIDRSDRDCVWRERPLGTKMRLEMWSPVRAVALLAKLTLPLRTFQVRMLDSGEADTWRYSKGSWTLNLSRLAHGSFGRPVQQGVFRKHSSLTDGEATSTVLYINTNKTADVTKHGPDKGYTLPWSFGGPLHQDIAYWLEKLRDWQEKYNPISRRVAWTELDGRHFNAKSEVQLADYSDACFLFRMREAAKHQRHLPLKISTLTQNWFRLLEALELRLAQRGETHQNGMPIRLLPPPEKQNGGRTTLYPLHSLRVSLITALALEGQVPFPILQKLVGHSRLLMTLYYFKPGALDIRDALLGAADRLEANKDASIQNFLLNTEHDSLLKTAICNSVSSLTAAVPQHPAARNPAGWMPMHHGLCLAGGNTSEVDGNGSVGGCYNGGSMITKGSSTGNPKYGPVPGGCRNCVRCRWFITEPHYLPALAAHFNTLAYHFDEARNTCLAREGELLDMKKKKADAEDAAQPFTLLESYRKAERLWESAMKRFSDLAEDLVACWRIIERCKAALEGSDGHAIKLVAAGTTCEVRIAFEETESELLQLVGLCENVEVYPDLEPGKAVFRRSQLLDAMLYREKTSPVFMLLSEQEQLTVGNAFMRRMAHQMNPENPVLGQRQVIHLIDAGKSLSQHFDMDLSILLPAANHAQVFPAEQKALAGGDA